MLKKQRTKVDSQLGAGLLEPHLLYCAWSHQLQYHRQHNTDVTSVLCVCLVSHIISFIFKVVNNGLSMIQLN